LVTWKALSHLRVRILDRYVIREVLPPTGLGLLLFTFVILLQQITIFISILISRGADLATTFKLFFNLLPSVFAITIPMAFLLGVLLAFGRLASESEIVAMRASGISPLQMLRPVLLLSFTATALTFYVMTVMLPPANSFYRQTFYTLVISKARSEIKPRVFTDDVLPGMVLYVSDIAADTGDWKNVFISDTRLPQTPQIIVARSGRLIIDDVSKKVALSLEQGYIHRYDRANPKDYYIESMSSGTFYLPFDTVFPKVPLAKGGREMTIDELSQSVDRSEAAAASLAAQGKEAEAQAQRLLGATFRVELHKKFSIPMACVVFGIVGLGLSLGNRKEARSAAFGLSIAVISVYYIFLRLGEQAGDTGMVAPWLGMWSANVVLGLVGFLLIFLNQREAAFDPLNPLHYAGWIPRVTRRTRPRPEPTPATRGALIHVPRPLPRRVGRLGSILDRYIVRQYLGFFGLMVVAFWCIFFLFDFMERMDEVNRNHIRGVVVVHYYAFFTPEILHLYIIPLATLVATLATFGVLSRRNEITAMKAGGISVYRAMVPIIFFGLFSSAILFVMGEYVVPHTSRLASRDLNEIRGRTQQSASVLERRWIMATDGKIYNYDYMSQGGSPGVAPVTATGDAISFYGLAIYEIDADAWNLKERTYAGRARWLGAATAPTGEYELERGWRWSFKGREVQYQPFGSVRNGHLEPPSTFVGKQPNPAAMKFAELSEHITSLERLGVDVSKLKVQLHEKLAFPIVALIMTLLGLRFSFTIGRRGALYGIGISILIGMGYLICRSLSEIAGNNALLPAGIAAWAPNILFGAAGLYLIMTLDT
jgi:LPS export ABC transporter permease LptF/LPS export ABC transporter permease LptG